jgi:excinuclease ABC subunit B
MAELIIRRGLSEPDTDANFVPHKPTRPPKGEGGKPFKLVSDYTPAGDQPAAIAELVAGANAIKCFWALPDRAKPSPSPR